MVKKTIFRRIGLIVKFGLRKPNLPKNILALQNYPLIRIFRVLGGISTICLISNKLSILGEGYIYIISLYVCVFITLSFNIYLFYIHYHRIKYIYKTMNKNKN